MNAEDTRLALAALNAITAFSTAVLVAWRRHGEPNPKLGDPNKVEQILMGIEIETEDYLTYTDKEMVGKMLADNVELTFVNAQSPRYGFKRAHWNKVRAALVAMGHAEYNTHGELIMRAGIFKYLGQPLPRWMTTLQNSEITASDTPNVDTPFAWGGEEVA